jgi:hypothetical protein
LTDTITYTWSLTGTKTITVEVSNVQDTMSDSHVITLVTDLRLFFWPHLDGSWRLYLPMILKGD